MTDADQITGELPAEWQTPDELCCARTYPLRAAVSARNPTHVMTQAPRLPRDTARWQVSQLLREVLASDGDYPTVRALLLSVWDADVIADDVYAAARLEPHPVHGRGTFDAVLGAYVRCLGGSAPAAGGYLDD